MISKTYNGAKPKVEKQVEKPVEKGNEDEEMDIVLVEDKSGLIVCDSLEDLIHMVEK